MEDINLENAILLADSNRGIYAAQHAIESLDPEKVTFENARHIDIRIVKSGPDPIDSYEYWQAWDDLQSCTIIEKETGKRFRFYQDGDIWLVPETE